MDEQEIKKLVRDGYGRLARTQSSCCPGASSCCGGEQAGEKTSLSQISKHMGYTAQDLASVPAGANLGLGCGNPVALSALRPGEIVLDLGSGAGFDAFLAAREVGASGRVIGVDMTPEMIDQARANAAKGGYENVEFRLGEIENLPLADQAVDVVLSNCVINLVVDKARVFREAFRVLRPGGRLMISDLVLLEPLPEAVQNSAAAYVACLAGAALKDEYLRAIAEAGFEEVRVVEEASFPVASLLGDPVGRAVAEELNLTREETLQKGEVISSVRVSAFKPDQPA